MWFTLISSLFSFLGGPVAKGLVDSYKAKLAAGNTSERIAADTAGKEIAAQVSETQSITQYRIAELGYWYEPDKILGYLVALLFAKLIVWDIVLGLGTTNLHDGFVLTTSNLIISFYFGKRGFENIAKIIKR